MAKFLTKEQEQTVIQAIKDAEMATSGEIRVHIEAKCKADDALTRAKEVFAELKMHETELRNGTIIYVATKDHKIAIWGDEGIHSKVGQDFWDQELELITRYFMADDYETGLKEAVLKIGEKLKEHFPYQTDDVNELPDDISYGEGH
ncbi:TPM domain-containing protein [Balneola vulgaris]|uniref:TPM domain-containing protein n=1 Tax=Balneola vulgaris TaxID=287535 RepID=UPI0003775707|nr:TPM domain-containing protein [Balneola vulgaris]